MYRPVLETGRLRLYPMSEDQLARAAFGLNWVVGSFGARISGRGYGFFEKMEKRRIYRAKRALILQSPEAWLLATMWLAVDREKLEMVGEAGFKGLPCDGEVEIGYSTRKPYRSQGYMTEAVGVMCKYAFEQKAHAVSSVCALTSPGNVASHKVLEKNGFTMDGTRGRLWYWKKENK